ncbi:MAG TPA: MarC family protein [bacterium]|nr:MarC family protein [bacterium]
MEHFFLFLLKATIAIFVILNPFGNVPVLFSLTPDLDKTGRRTVITKASLTALFVLLLFAVTGQLVFDFFHITIGAFRIAGGALLFIISISMLWGEMPRTKITEKEKAVALEKETVAVTPMGVPMIAGPGSIVTVISLMDQAANWTERSAVLGAVPLAIVAGYFVLLAGSLLMSRVGEGGLRVMTRMMGLILAVIAVQFMINGLHDALPQILGK